MICRKCHKEIPDRSRYCNWCGTAQSTHSHSRGNGEGSIYKVSRSGKWAISITIGYRTDPQNPARVLPVRKYQYGYATKKAALAGLERLQDKYEEAVPMTSGDVKVPTFTFFWKELEQAHLPKLSKNRQQTYRHSWERLSLLHDVDIRDMTVAGLQNVVNQANPEGRYYPAKDMKNLLSKLYQSAMAYSIVPNNLAKFIQLPELQEQSHEPFTLPEVETLWKHYEKGNPFTGYILLMIYTGMMPGELLDCRKENIDWNRHEIIGAGKKTKRRKESPILFGPEIEEVLHTLIEFSPNPEKLVGMNKDHFYEVYYQTLQDCGIRKLPPYSCRHTTATVLADLQTPVPVIKGIMRHAKMQTTQRYIHTEDSRLRQAVDHMEHSLSPSDKDTSA